MRFLGYTMGDPSAPMTPPSPDEMAKMGAFVEEATKAGVLLATGGVAPLDQAVKVRYHGGEYTVLDGRQRGRQRGRHRAAYSARSKSWYRASASGVTNGRELL